MGGGGGPGFPQAVLLHSLSLSVLLTQLNESQQGNPGVLESCETWDQEKYVGRQMTKRGSRFGLGSQCLKQDQTAAGSLIGGVLSADTSLCQTGLRCFRRQTSDPRATSEPPILA